jgi:hypothetical protein
MAQALALRPEYVRELIEFGAVYYAEVARPVGGAEKRRGALQTEKEFQQWKREIQPRRLLADQPLPPGAYVRYPLAPASPSRALAPYDEKLRIGLLGWDCLGGGQLTRPFRYARRFPSPGSVQRATRSTRKFGRCPPFKDHFLSPRAKPFTIRNFCIAVTVDGFRSWD